MNRSSRTVLVLLVAVGLASGATFLVYQAIKNRPTREVEVAHIFAVVAAHPLQLGARLTAADVKQVPWPAANPVPGGFTATDQVVNRGVVVPIAENEPLTSNNIAAAEAGAGLPPTIPTGMRALSVRVNEVIGVAGFVVPGTRVDVLVILRNGSSSVARVVVSNVQVLTAGTRYDQQEVAKEGKAIPSSVVTLMVSPEDAEKVGLAANEGQLLLTLRNPLDTEPTKSTGVTTASLLGGASQPVSDAVSAEAASRPAPARKIAAAPPPPPPPAPPKTYMIEVIRAAKRSEEQIK